MIDPAVLGGVVSAGSAVALVIGLWRSRSLLADAWNDTVDIWLRRV